ncbi:hypothetical protein EUGRSUZ_E02172 [Eucalyptus grandis]|uniref:Uncharacterized protein n=2 Tax=Eucalyptus grandis TaxID=71139 RepID=A0ACC3KXB5_EUCGR|nr:hypothetical protein EUGRSUZ_E02172 [Eucalyptus grandis]
MSIIPYCHSKKHCQRPNPCHSVANRLKYSKVTPCTTLVICTSNQKSFHLYIMYVMFRKARNHKFKGLT